MKQKRGPNVGIRGEKDGNKARRYGQSILYTCLRMALHISV